MCDLFGMSCNAKDRATRSLPVFAEKYSDINPDGWGIAYYAHDKAVIERQEGKAKGNQKFDTAIQHARSNIIISHLRQGTGTLPCEVNCHPFTRKLKGLDWVFAHNGQVHNVPIHLRSKGQTDSEQVFNFMLDELVNYQRSGKIKGIYPGLVYAIEQVFKKFSRDINFNFLMSDGTILYAFNHYTAKPLYYLHREKEYGGAFLISTQKLTTENWTKIPADRLLLVRKADFLVLSDPIR